MIQSIFLLIQWAENRIHWIAWVPTLFLVWYPILQLRYMFLYVLLSTHSIDPCLWGGGSDHPDFGPTDGLSLHQASSSNTPMGSVHKSRGANVVRMWVQLKRWCVSCVCMLQRTHSGEGCVLASTLYKYDLRKGDLFVLRLGMGAMSDAGKYLFRAADVWWRCAQNFVIFLLWLEAYKQKMWVLDIR